MLKIPWDYTKICEGEFSKVERIRDREFIYDDEVLWFFRGPK